jgi:diguanylate cyclase (GGDEF)-like protein/PAS domain S-box-containing protein
MIGYNDENGERDFLLDSLAWKKRLGINGIDAIRTILGFDVSDELDEKFERIHQILDMEQRFNEAVINCIPGIFYVFTDECRLIKWNNRLLEISDSTEDNLAYQELYSWFRGDDMIRVAAAVEIMLSTGYSEVEAEFVTMSGKHIPMLFNLAPLKVGDKTYFTGIGIDVSDRKLKEEIAGNLMFYDTLTGLPNRIKAFHIVDEHIKNHIDPNHKDALLFIDIDNFKFVNDTFGHVYGDALLAKIAEKLKSLICDRIHVARFEGDEFFVFILDTNDAEVKDLSAKILALINEEMEVQGKKSFVSASIGIALYPEHANNFEELMQYADTAINKAKYGGKDRFEFFDFKLHERIKNRVEITSQLRGALENNELLLYYQPQLDMKTCKITGLEALIRWNNPQQGMVSPAVFIPIAEETGLIIDIGNFVLREAAGFVRQLRELGFHDVKIAVNVSVMQMNEKDFVANLLQIIKDYKIPPSSITLEVTESILIKSFDVIREKLVSLRKEGFHISLDDFGTGYSSLTYLKTLPINCLKIDKSFIDDIATNEIDKGLTVSIIQIAHQLGLSVIAEGVEQMEQYHYLFNNECDSIQGYYYSKPLPEEQVIQLIYANNEAAI